MARKKDQAARREQLVHATIELIALINTYNRMNVVIQQPAGDYQPGQWQ